MWIKSKKTMLAIEWIWLLIGTAVVFAHLVEAWASPYLPALWMIGVLALFLVYRLGIAVREVYWPEPVREEFPTFEKRPPEAVKRHGGDGVVSTAEWVPPHIRGRNVPQKRADQKRGSQPSADASPAPNKPAERLELPAASGKFDGAEIATVFAEVDEDTEPESTEFIDVGVPFQATSIVRVDKSDLRPETEADLSQSDLVIPSFAESALTGDERKRVIEAVRHDEVTGTHPGPRRPARSEEDTVTQPGPKRPPPSDEDTVTQPGPKRPARSEEDTVTQPGPKRRATSDEDTVTQPGPKRPSRSGADTVTQPGPKPPAAPDDDTNPIRVKKQRHGNGDDEGPS